MQRRQACRTHRLFSIPYAEPVEGEAARLAWVVGVFFTCPRSRPPGSRIHALFHVLAARAQIVTRLQVITQVFVLRRSAREPVPLIGVHLIFRQPGLAGAFGAHVAVFLEGSALGLGLRLATVLHSGRRAGTGRSRALAGCAARLSALPACLRGEFAILRETAPFWRHGFAALSAGLRGQLWVLRETSFFWRHALAALARDRALLFPIHGSKTAIGRALWLLVVSRSEERR